MYKFGRNSKMIILLMANKTPKSQHITRLIDIMHGLATLYNVRISNEKTLYSTFIQEPGDKLIVILLNETGVENRQFRESIRTCLAAKINIIGILDENLTEERVSGFFNLNAKHSKLLDYMINKAIRFEKDVLFRATDLVDRIQNLCRPISGFSRPKLPKISEPVSVELKACLNLKKVVLKPVNNTRNQYKPLVKFPAMNKIIAFPPLATKKCLPQRKASNNSLRSRTSDIHEKTTYPRIEISKASQGSSRTKTASGKSKQKTQSPIVIEPKLNCPTIEISREEDQTQFPDEITKEQDRLPWMITPFKQVDLLHNKQEDRNGVRYGKDDLVVADQSNKRRFSFEYISKTYVVCDPTYKKTLYVNFPYGTHLLKRDSASDILRSVHSRRNSLLYNGSVNSSIDEINLEAVFDSINVFDSPIPSPVCRNTSFIYQNPLPVFPDENCFPPLETFPCDTLQMRRPSVFDVLLH